MDGENININAQTDVLKQMFNGQVGENKNKNVKIVGNHETFVKVHR